MWGAIPFEKWVAAGNDFIVLDNRDGRYGADAGVLARRLCHRHHSVGADGLILIEESPTAHLRARFFNPDGTEFQMCMNGTRCVARYALDRGIAPARMTIETAVGGIEAEAQGFTVRLRFFRPYALRLRESVEVRGRAVTVHWVRVGDPHLVVPVRDVDVVDLPRLGPLFRNHPAFGPEGTNVHFVHVRTRGVVTIRTYERGVEGETLSCGSGCVSTALVLAHLGHRWPTYRFETRAGVPLTVRLGWADDRLTHIELAGEARRVCEGCLFLDASP